jgi:hypothetical protein
MPKKASTRFFYVAPDFSYSTVDLNETSYSFYEKLLKFNYQVNAGSRAEFSVFQIQE